MTRCLILGGNGFIGSNLAQGLVRKGYDVRVFDSFQTGLPNLEVINCEIEVLKGDFRTESDINNSLKNVDWLFHFISTTVPATAKKDPVYDIESNITGTVKLLQQAVNNNIKKVIYPSSGGTIYGEPVHLPVRETDPLNPLDPYAISKLTIEKYLYYFKYAYGLDFMVLRYSNPFGERQNPYGQQGVIPIFLNAIKNGERPVIYGDGSMVRDYIYISDAVEASIAALESHTSERIFNVGSGIGTSLNELLDIISDVVGRKIAADYNFKATNYIQKIVLDISRVQKEAGWKPKTSLRDGIARTWEWIRKTREIIGR